jgi:hypothetical protein
MVEDANAGVDVGGGFRLVATGERQKRRSEDDPANQ